MRRGFTLLEVMVSIAILGLGLTAILSAQANAFTASAHARDLSEATGMLRCKMLEVEEQLMRDGFSELDVDGSGDCCEDIEHPRMTCKWTIAKPEFPEPALGELDLDSGLDTDALGPLGGLAGAGKGSSLPSSGDVGDLAQSFAGIGGPPGGGDDDDDGGGGGLGGIFGMMLNMVYPDVKPLFEASARRVLVTVEWRRGTQTRTVELVQWVVNPNKGVAAAEVDLLGEALDDVLGDGAAAPPPGGGGSPPPRGGNSRSPGGTERPTPSLRGGPRRRPARSALRGLTLLEVLVSIGILALIGLLIYGAFDGMARSRKGLSSIGERYHQGRLALTRMSRELQSAFLTQHQPLVESQRVRETAFIGHDRSPIDRIDFTSFSHRRIRRDSHESDQNELSYFGSRDPKSNAVDLARRESAFIDMDPTRGGVVNVMVEDVDSFDVSYLDPVTGEWTNTWDTTQAVGQSERLPLQVKLKLTLNGGRNGSRIVMGTRASLAMQAPLNFFGLIPQGGTIPMGVPN